jgi:hypothetical protein
MTYSEKLRDPRWQKKRLEILNRDGFSCCLCGDKETELHVHHKKYYKEPWNAKDESLQTLCKYCHLLVELSKNEKCTPPSKVVKIVNEYGDIRLHGLFLDLLIITYGYCDIDNTLVRCYAIDIEDIPFLMKFIQKDQL